MGEINTGLQFSHEFTTDIGFETKYEKFKCFRVFDEHGKIVNKNPYVEKFIKEKGPDYFRKMYACMVKMNEADRVFA